MFKHIDLCVEMKKRNYAKEALMQYRNMCHQINVASLEEVIRYFLKKASEKAEEAQAAAAAVSLARTLSLALWSPGPHSCRGSYPQEHWELRHHVSLGRLCCGRSSLQCVCTKTAV